MNRTLTFVSIAVFSVFLGSQITEGFLLVPFWKTLSSTEFYAYYAEFGPLIGRFYTCLTIIAVLIPFGLSFYCYYYKPHALKYAIVSTLFAVLVIAVFYGYFKDTNQQFFEAVFDTHQLQSVLDDWEYYLKHNI